MNWSWDSAPHFEPVVSKYSIVRGRDKYASGLVGMARDMLPCSVGISASPRRIASDHPSSLRCQRKEKRATSRAHSR